MLVACHVPMRPKLPSVALPHGVLYSRFAPCSAKCLVIVSGSLLAVAALYVRRSLRWPLTSPSHLPDGVLWNPARPLDISASLIAHPVEDTGD